MAAPPRPFLSREEIEALSPQERAVAIAEWSSYNTRLRLEQERRGAPRGAYRGARSRGGRGRGRGHYSGYQPYPSSHHAQHPIHHFTPTFKNPAYAASKYPGAPVSSESTIASQDGADNAKKIEENGVEKAEPCPAFTSTGICRRSRCANAHDPDKTAICKPFLFKGECPKNQSCPLSHEPSPHRSPHCIHFQNEHCNKDDCRYAHIHVNESAPVCEAFARLGYCEKGTTCPKRHTFECPDFANKGTCETPGCRLPHIKHAGRLRKARKSSETGSEPASGSEEETSGIERTDYSHALTQQADFVPLDA